MTHIATAVLQRIEYDGTQLLLSYKGFNLMKNIVSTVLQVIKFDDKHGYCCLTRH
jgi:hypothetical protein